MKKTQSPLKRKVTQPKGGVSHKAATSSGNASSELTKMLLKVEKSLHSISENETSQRFRQLRTALNDPHLNVVVFGEFNRGKSTLINALLGRCVLPAKLVPTTGQVTRVVFSIDEDVHVTFVDGRKESCELERLSSFTTLNADGFAREDVESVEVGVNSPWLKKGIVLLDTPGLNDRENQTRRAKIAISQADIVLFVLDARQLLGSYEKELAVDWLTQGLNKTVVPVLNFMNQVPEGERAEMRLRLDRWSRKHLGKELGKPWFEVDALGALRKARAGGNLLDDDCDGLRDALAACRGMKRSRLQQRSRRGQLLNDVREAREGNARIVSQLQFDASKLERERSAKRNDIKDLARRFRADARLKRESVTISAQQTLSNHLDKLVSNHFHGKNQASLEKNADRWYRDMLAKAVREVERAGSKEMLLLAGDNLPRPEPFVVWEKMVRSTRIEVNDMAAITPIDSAVLWGAGIGAAIGTFVAPLLGTVVGGYVGGWLGGFLGSTDPDYPAAFAKKARECWEKDGCKLVALLQEEFDARARELKRHIDARLQELRPRPASTELKQRERLEAALAVCECKLRLK